MKKYIRKIAASSLILALAFFAGSFCLHPMSAQAMDAAPAMAMAGHAMDDGADAAIGDDTPVSAWNICVVDCASETPQAVAAKKFSVDFSTDFPAGISDEEMFRLSESSSDLDDSSGVSPSPPDILSSVFKKE